MHLGCGNGGARHSLILQIVPSSPVPKREGPVAPSFGLEKVSEAEATGEGGKRGVVPSGKPGPPRASEGMGDMLTLSSVFAGCAEELDGAGIHGRG